MNYSRVYDEFIADRRLREPRLVGYTERHHVVPRALGGSDDKDNLIRLTPEDHFFAHLCLARIHGGSMWVPLVLMRGGSKRRWIPSQSRRKYGWASRLLSQAIAEGKTLAEVHKLRHKDGREWQGIQAQMPVDLGLSKPLANMLVKGRVKSAKGWYLAHMPEPHRGDSHHPMYRREVYDFVHKSGDSFTGTQHELHKAKGVTKSGVCKLVRGQAKTWAGWRVAGGK